MEKKRIIMRVLQTGRNMNYDGGVEREDQAVLPPLPPPLPAAQQHGHAQPQLGGQAQGELLQTRVRPVIPGPERLMGGAEVDGDGWSAIDCVGAWDCMLVKFAMLQEVPVQHQEVWVEAFSRVFQMIEDADAPAEKTRALK